MKTLIKLPINYKEFWAITLLFILPFSKINLPLFLKYLNKKLIAFPIYEGWLDLGKKKNLVKFLKSKN